MRPRVSTKTLASAVLLISAFQLHLNARDLPMTIGNSSRLPSNAVDMGEQASKLLGLLGGDSSVETIGRKSKNLGDGMPGAAILIRAQFHPWQIEKEVGEATASVSDLIDAARSRIEMNSNRIPPASVSDTLATIDEMNSLDRISYEKLPSNELGLYHKVCGSKSGDKAGMIGLHPHLADISTQVGRPIAACVLFHEAGHASDSNICDGSVEDVESVAFHREYDCIKAIYPTGEEIATTDKMLDNEEKYRPSPVIEESRNFILNIYQVFKTGGNDQKIRELVHKLYNSDGTPKSSGA